jgi:hypothetical protein
LAATLHIISYIITELKIGAEAKKVVAQTALLTVLPFSAFVVAQFPRPNPAQSQFLVQL